MPANKLNPEVQEIICRAIRSGNYLHTAAEAAGVSRQTVWNWKEKGEKALTGKYRDFFDALKKAEAEAVQRNVALIQIAAETQWTAAAWWLERKHPNDFGRLERVEHTGADGRPLVLTFVAAEKPDDAGA